MLSLLTILFIGLKLTGYIDWSWWLVLMPTLVSLSGWFFLLIVAAFAQTKKRY